MEGYDSATYGERVADVYDDWYARLGDVASCTGRLETLARQASPDHQPVVLELGIGTGRVALPLSATGLDVRGIDSSPAMLAALHSKAGSSGVATAVGDMSAPRIPARPDEPGGAPHADLVFVAFNTLFMVTTPDQRRCFDEVSGLLSSDGLFVIEAFVPDLPEHEDNSVKVRSIDAARLVLTASVVDRKAQTITGQHVDITEKGIELRPWVVHYQTPAQLDGLAVAAGFVLESRWADYDCTPFDPDTSPTHVSVYRST